MPEHCIRCSALLKQEFLGSVADGNFCLSCFDNIQATEYFSPESLPKCPHCDMRMTFAQFKNPENNEVINAWIPLCGCLNRYFEERKQCPTTP